MLQKSCILLNAQSRILSRNILTMGQKSCILTTNKLPTTSNSELQKSCIPLNMKIII